MIALCVDCINMTGIKTKTLITSRIGCSRCGTLEDIEYTSNSPYTVEALFRIKGWLVDKEETVCPSCTGPEICKISGKLYTKYRVQLTCKRSSHSRSLQVGRQFIDDNFNGMHGFSDDGLTNIDMDIWAEDPQRAAIRSKEIITSVYVYLLGITFKDFSNAKIYTYKERETPHGHGKQTLLPNY